MDPTITRLNLVLQKHFEAHLDANNDLRVLLLGWANATQGAEVKELHQHFETLGAEVEAFEIPFTNSQAALGDRVARFIQASSDSRTVIVYYRGGGVLRHGKPIWKPLKQLSARATSTSSSSSRNEGGSIRRSSNHDAESASVSCLEIQKQLQLARFDVLLLTDCDYGRFSKNRDGDGVSPFPSSERDLRGKFEILAAPCGVPQPKTSFTSLVLQGLNYFAEDDLDVHRLATRMADLSDSMYKHNYLKLSNHGSSIVLQSVKRESLQLTQPADEKLTEVLEKWATGAPPAQDALKWMQRLQADVSQHSSISICSQTTTKTGCEVSDEDSYFDAIVQRWNCDEELRHIVLPQRANHDTVRVLPIMWSETGFIPRQEEWLIDEMQNVRAQFLNYFDYEVEEIFRIPTQNCQQALTDLIRQYTEDGNPKQLRANDLLIVIYSGHGKDTLGEDGSAVWLGRGTEEVNWSTVQLMLDQANFDVVQIMDCCYSAAAAKARNQGRNELLTASGFEKPTYLGSGSFLHMIMEDIQELAKENKPFSFQTLSNRVTTRTKKYNQKWRTGKPKQPTRYYQLQEGSSSTIYLWPRGYQDPYNTAYLPHRPVGDAEGRSFVTCKKANA
ncbi:hypothetical protein GQ53DRAFT_854997 [Thozetella sp. PMI_491]|nr:hypothetical protein GQ53DRAFT_854997 [Thozetella sp. PMI_491]